ncbi:MAG: RNA polymerase subunit sigma-24 [Candidatus Cloacimonadota bacterium]|nr:MAG: RNA polymerase subunit sigma-24 [Candidatus Cloacimonadota bacterium]PIE81112.1 MAG: RNA polymerase subunit sigma-24 [Candidatus Delongbacteria bacterium]
MVNFLEKNKLILNFTIEKKFNIQMLGKRLERMRDSDETLMHKFQDGDETAFDELVERYKNKLSNHIFYYVKNREMVEDIVQNAFVRIYFNKEKYKDVAKVSTWIYTIAINLAKTELAKKSRAEIFSITGKDGETDFEIPDSKADTSDNLMRSELKEVIYDGIDMLEDKFREIILMRDVDELTYEEIATILDIPVGTVKSRLNRARLNLRDILQDYIKS